MKTPFEKELKSRLENIEMPYDASAWDNIQQTLDKNNRGKSNTKWILSSLLLVALSVTGYFTLKTPENRQTAQNEAVLNTPNIEKEEDSKVEKPDVEIEKTEIEKAKTLSNIEEEKKPNIESELEQKAKTTTTTVTENKNKQTEGVLKDIKVNEPQKVYNLPVMNNICKGEVRSIKNENDIDLLLFSPDGKEIKIEQFSTFNFESDKIGTYELKYLKDGRTLSASSFTVISIDKLDFEIDNEKIYKNGIPTRSVESNSVLTSTQWFLNNKMIAENTQELELNLFKKGDYRLKLINENKNGCKSTIEKQIRIEKDYNLLAVDAFSPSEFNDKINSFLPFALTLRNVKFNFFIIDPKDGGIVYETNDKLKPWDGIDRRSGQLVEINSNWVWKAIIEQPEKGEDSAYKGIVVRL